MNRLWKVINQSSRYYGCIFLESYKWPDRDGGVSLLVDNKPLYFMPNEIEEAK